MDDDGESLLYIIMIQHQDAVMRTLLSHCNVAVSCCSCGRQWHLGEFLWGFNLQVNAIVGGVLANEILKAVSGRGEPLDNLFMYRCASVALQSDLGNLVYAREDLAMSFFLHVPIIR